MTQSQPQAGSKADPAATRARNLRTIRRVLPYLWPEGQSWVKRRVVLSMTALVLAQLFSLITPMFFKAAVDALTGKADSHGMALLMGAVGLTVAYGVARLGNSAFS